jgi:hypothetical protein
VLFFEDARDAILERTGEDKIGNTTTVTNLFEKLCNLPLWLCNMNDSCSRRLVRMIELSFFD